MYLLAQHPDADRLKITTVDLGNGVLYKLFAVLLMCRTKVPVAIGTILYDATGAAFTIKKEKKFVDKKVME
jgi:phenylalanyl-tRNA synthetase beta chain